MVGDAGETDTCTFCGFVGDMSREHVLPNWLRKEVPRPDTGYDQWGRRVEPLLNGGVRIVPYHFKENYPLGARKLKAVCNRCNNGWMSALQILARPRLTDLVGGVWNDWNERDAAIISSWLSMTAAVMAMSYDTKGIRISDRRFLAEEHKTPKKWMTWIGRCSGADGLDYRNRVVGREVSRGTFVIWQPSSTVITTIVIGRLLLHAISSNETPKNFRPDIYEQRLGLLPLHPWSMRSRKHRLLPIVRAASTEFYDICDGFSKTLNLAV